MNQIPVQPKVSKEREALAPYNFIPLPEKVITLSVNDLPDQGYFHPNLLTGYIDCELTTSSPIFIRAGLRPDQAQSGKQSKDLPEFFYLTDKNEPRIPGSSIRGMLRTLVEIVTFSKIGAVSKNRLVYRSVGGTTNHDAHYRDQMMCLDREEKVGKNVKYYTPRIRGGYMVRIGAGDWAIQPARTIGGTTYAHIGIDEAFFRQLKRVKNCQNAFDLYIQTGPYQYQEVRGGFLQIKFAKVTQKDDLPKPGLRKATLARSGWMNSKKSEAVIYEADPNVELLPLTDSQIDAYKDQVSKEQQKLLGDNGVLNHGQPVFYLLDEETGGVKFFGHTRMFRIPYPNSPLDYVPDYARPTDDPANPDEIDFVEAIFGYTRKSGEGKQRAYAGRVSCSDGQLDSRQEDIWLSKNPVTLQILSGPKPTTFQHYLIQPEPEKYLIGETRGGEIKTETRLRDYELATPGDTVICGHKFYWHKGAISLEKISEKNEVKSGDTQHTHVLPLKPGVQFRFKVHFENLRMEELGALIWIFRIAADPGFRLKIGMGKPVGMGAVSIKPSLFIQKPQHRYGSLFSNGEWADGFERVDEVSQEAVEAFVGEVLDALNDGVPPDEQVDNLLRVRRIQALLKMLQWPGPDQERTRYMEIEHPDFNERRGKRNEYKERPVLPSPFGVWTKKNGR